MLDSCVSEEYWYEQEKKVKKLKNKGVGVGFRATLSVSDSVQEEGEDGRGEDWVKKQGSSKVRSPDKSPLPLLPAGVSSSPAAVAADGTARLEEAGAVAGGGGGGAAAAGASAAAAAAATDEGNRAAPSSPASLGAAGGVPLTQAGRASSVGSSYAGAATRGSAGASAGGSGAGGVTCQVATAAAAISGDDQRLEGGEGEVNGVQTGAVASAQQEEEEGNGAAAAAADLEAESAAEEAAMTAAFAKSMSLPSSSFRQVDSAPASLARDFLPTSGNLEGAPGGRRGLAVSSSSGSMNACVPAYLAMFKPGVDPASR